ncbi:MAG: hypothetical protein ACRCU5_13835 [Rhizobiaceae bacterium]
MSAFETNVKGDVMIDRYTKFTLTVIAVSLTIIAANQLAPTKAMALGDCGSRMTNPCWVTLGTETVEVQTSFPLQVRVMN